MSAWRRLPRWIRIATTSVVGAVLAGVVFGYEREETTHCAACGAITNRRERGVALSLSLRLPVFVKDEVEPMPNTLRFLPADHSHGRERSVRSSQSGPYVLLGAWGCGRQFPGEFAFAIAGRRGFADFVASRIDAGTVDIATVRSLIAQPALRGAEDQGETLERRGEDLIAEFEREER